MTRRGAIGLWVPVLAVLAQAPPKVQVIQNRLVSGRAPHSAYTDLARFHDRWFLVFREGSQVVHPDGALRLLASSDGDSWAPMALLAVPEADLRYPALSAAPDDRLVLTAAAVWPDRAASTLIWHSFDGREWMGPEKAGEPGELLGRFGWYLGRGYAMAHDTAAAAPLKLYTSTPGLYLSVHAPSIPVTGQAEDAALLFQPDGSAVSLVNREGATALLGRSRSPFRGWTWKDTGRTIVGANLIRLPDGRVLGAGRLVDDTVRTSLFWVEADTGAVAEFYALPSSGDTGYPGLAFHDGVLWVSYYSSHEGRASVYLAKLRLPPAIQTEKPQRLTFGK
jgi:hypothetical protein